MSNLELSNQMYYVIVNEYGSVGTTMKEFSYMEYFSSIEEAKKYFERNHFDCKRREEMDKMPSFQGFKNQAALRNQWIRNLDLQMEKYRSKFTIHSITFNFVENA